MENIETEAGVDIELVLTICSIFDKEALSGFSGGQSPQMPDNYIMDLLGSVSYITLNSDGFEIKFNDAISAYRSILVLNVSFIDEFNPSNKISKCLLSLAQNIKKSELDTGVVTLVYPDGRESTLKDKSRIELFAVQSAFDETPQKLMLSFDRD